MATLHFTSATLYDYLDLGQKANAEITQRYMTVHCRVWQCIKLIMIQSRLINWCVSVCAARKKQNDFVCISLSTPLTSIVMLSGTEETVSNVLHSLAYFQITCFDQQCS